MSMMFEVSRTLRHACYWLIEQFGDNLQIEKSVKRLKERLTSVYTRPSATLSPNARIRHESAAAEYISMGVSESLAERMSALLLTRVALDIADLSYVYKRDVGETAKLYALFNQHLGMFWLHSGAEDLKVKGRWQAMARSNLREEFYRLRRAMAEPILASRSKKPVNVRLDRWLADNQASITRFRSMIDEMKLRGAFDFATLSVAAQELRQLISK
jgi:glutamate dehydrogenase